MDERAREVGADGLSEKDLRSAKTALSQNFAIAVGRLRPIVRGDGGRASRRFGPFDFVLVAGL